MKTTDKNTNLYFMGFMASGKSRIGKATARLLGWPFTDTDKLIEMRAGTSIAQIFADRGEAEFRQLERAVVREISHYQRWVIALGGGAILDENNWQLISSSGITICLTAPIEELCERISRNRNRPLVANTPPDKLRDTIQAMLDLRKPYYQKADYNFENHNDLVPIVLAQKILKKIGFA